MKENKFDTVKNGGNKNNIEEDEYAKEIIKKVKEIEIGLNYYIERSQKLENEINQYKIMYENRVEEYLKLKQQIKESQKENKELKKDYYNVINKIENKIDRFDYEFEKAKRQNNKDKSDYYWDLIINFKQLLGSEE